VDLVPFFHFLRSLFSLLSSIHTFTLLEPMSSRSLSRSDGSQTLWAMLQHIADGPGTEQNKMVFLKVLFSTFASPPLAIQRLQPFQSVQSSEGQVDIKDQPKEPSPKNSELKIKKRTRVTFAPSQWTPKTPVNPRAVGFGFSRASGLDQKVAPSLPFFPSAPLSPDSNSVTASPVCKKRKANLQTPNDQAAEQTQAQEQTQTQEQTQAQDETRDQEQEPDHLKRRKVSLSLTDL